MGWLKIQKLEYLEKEIKLFYKIKKFLTCAGLLLAIYCVQYLHAVLFLRNEIIYFLEKPSKLYALNLENLEWKIHNCALLQNFPALFNYTACMPLFSRINPSVPQITHFEKLLFIAEVAFKWQLQKCLCNTFKKILLLLINGQRT